MGKNVKLNAPTFGLSLFLLAISFTSSFSGSSNCIDIQTGKEISISIEANTSRGLQVDIGADVSNDRLTGTFYNLSRFWDGHIQGLLTGEGVSIIYEDAFGGISIQQINAYIAHNGSKVPGQGWIKSFNFDNCKISMKTKL